MQLHALWMVAHPLEGKSSFFWSPAQGPLLGSWRRAVVALLEAVASLIEVAQAPASSQRLSTQGGPVVQAATQPLTNFLKILVALTDHRIITISHLLTLLAVA